MDLQGFCVDVSRRRLSVSGGGCRSSAPTLSHVRRPKGGPQLGTMSPGPALRLLWPSVSLKSKVGLPEIVVKSNPRGLNVPEILPMTAPLRLTMSMSPVLSDTKRVPLYCPHPEGANAICRRPSCPSPSGIVVNRLTRPVGLTE